MNRNSKCSGLAPAAWCWLACSLLAVVGPLSRGAAAQEPGSAAALHRAELTDSSDDETSPLPLPDGDDLDQLLDLAEQNVDQLARVQVSAPALQVEVSTVSRQKSTVGRTPAAVYVITQEMIRRSGVTSLPEALRLAPGVQVARIDASKWAISIRGFNGRFANKLLVQIDGRSVYTPLFAGVFWDVQDMVLGDVERIEVIRGPGATVWGANAVNGVINVITKRASQTQGMYVRAGTGTEDKGLISARHGGKWGEHTYYRTYGKWFERDNSYVANSRAPDDWRMGRGGFRMDWEPEGSDTMTLQGDAYQGYAGQRNFFPDPTNPPRFMQSSDTDFYVAGGNVLHRWTRQWDDETEWSLQTYLDRTERELVNSGFREDRNTLDVDFQYRFPLTERQKIICGFGYRYTEDFIRNMPPVISFLPDKRALNLFSYFVQDEVTLLEDQVYWTVGSKFQHNDFTGFEIQPTSKLLWTPSERHSLWMSVSRAVRTPSRAEDDVSILLPPTSFPPLPPPTFPQVVGNRAVESEEMTAYEAGIRVQPVDYFSWDLALFYHDYDKLSSSRMGMPFGFGPTFLPLVLENGGRGQTYGFELAATCTIAPHWDVSGGYSLLRMDLQGALAEGESPRNQLFAHSSWDFAPGYELDVIGRYVDSLPAMNVSSYFVADVRLGRKFSENLEGELVGRHLLDSQHPEFGFDRYTGNIATEVQRELFGSLTWRR